MRTFGVALAMLLAGSRIALGAEAFDHLEPDDSSFDRHPQDDFPRIVHTVFKEAWERNVEARMLSLGGGPGVNPEEVVDLKKNGDSYSIEYLKSPVPLFEYSYLARRFHATDLRKHPEAGKAAGPCGLPRH